MAGGKVFALGGSGNLICANAESGKQEWSISLIKDLGGVLQNWGYTESPLVDGDLVIVTPGGSKGAIAGIDAKTGKVKWQTSDVTENAQYSSIIPIDHGGQRQYVQLLMKSILSVSKEGKVLWKTDFPGAVAVIPDSDLQGRPGLRDCWLQGRQQVSEDRRQQRHGSVLQPGHAESSRRSHSDRWQALRPQRQGRLDLPGFQNW
ncbi:MAG: PQQ-binding-like beta-propeller repeat protein [Verrucomicrobiaceae bacterium]|nr:PQQ-binding-like beta-propeller repeat protein [Verrucomicrobiaceae bacterium]